ncbi:MAG: alpha/beta hydrolase [Proteobacteria bacterium]|nr:alpha/beta hydrolase [Pseudomonadota bacterium]
MPLFHLDVDGHGVCVADSAARGTSGALEAPAIVLIHGAGHDHGVWDEVAATLAAAGHRTIAPDLPGHGASEGAALADIDTQAAWLVRLLDALDCGRMCLVGHSMGSLTALAAAARAAERCAKLVLVGSVAPMPVAPFLLDAARDDPPAAWAMVNKWSFGPVEELGEARLAALQAHNLQRMQRQPGGSLAIDLGACNAWQDGLTAASRVCCPALLICGERDRMTPPETAQPLFDALRATAGGASMIRIPGAGHSMMDEAPQILSDAIRTFVAAAP